ncbi:hypothetical protein [Massilia varians]|uniref:hypothetical protein n=1 Tax=Massilia varians TaxID=457921 RepID=UPI0024907B89|nr:hypothetical protein [Massilia varians]
MSFPIRFIRAEALALYAIIFPLGYFRVVNKYSNGNNLCKNNFNKEKLAICMDVQILFAFPYEDEKTQHAIKNEKFSAR